MSPIVVFIESPFNGDVEGNMEYLRECMWFAYTTGYAPIALHGLYPFLPDGKLHSDDEDVGGPGREHALQCCKATRERCDEVWFFIDKGFSSGMDRALKESPGLTVKFFKKIGHRFQETQIE